MAQTIIYNKIGTGYNHTRKADPYIAARLYALLDPVGGNNYLDIGCGTGNYTIRMAGTGLNFIGIDPSAIMLDEAKYKSKFVSWIQGSSENIPLADNSVDGAIATLTIHHWPDLEKGFKELARVLKTGSSIVIFSFTKEQERGYWLNYFFPEMMKRSCQKAINFETVAEAALKAGLDVIETEKYFVQEDLQDLFCYSGKHDPEIYFDPLIRNGISSFALLADKEEVGSGLLKLRNSIDSGEFEAIRKQYDNDLGDYLFIVLKKS